MPETFTQLRTRITACRTCANRFAKTATAHAPRPVFWLSKAAPILVAGQAPGARVFKSGRPFDDRSGDRLRAWMGVTREVFYDRRLVSVLPMAFCFPGYNAKGADLPPPPICAKSWHHGLMAAIAPPKLTLLIGGHAQKWHLGEGYCGSVSETLRNWRRFAPDRFVLPHPSWRNTGWLKNNPWFEADLLPVLRRAVQTVIAKEAE